MKQLKSKIDELDATKNKLTDVSVQKDNLQNQWNDVNQVTYLAFSVSSCFCFVLSLFRLVSV